jgi:hypothetical protein
LATKKQTKLMITTKDQLGRDVTSKERTFESRIQARQWIKGLYGIYLDGPCLRKRYVYENDILRIENLSVPAIEEVSS